MEDYLTETPVYIISISVFYFILLYILTIFFAKVILKDRIKNYFLIFILMTFHYVIVLWNSLLGFIPFFPDTKLYTKIIKSINSPDDFGLTSLSYFIVTYVPKMFLLLQPMLFVLFNVFLFIISIFFIFKGWELLRKEKFSYKFESIYWVLLIIFPTSYYFISTLLRETFFVFGFSLFFYGLILFKEQEKKIVLIIGFVILGILRFQFVIFTIPILIITILIKYFKNVSVRKIVLTTTVLLFFSLIANFLLSYRNYQLSAEWISRFRNFHIDAFYDSGVTYGRVEWHNYFDMFLDSFPLGAQFLLSPLKIISEHNPLKTFVMFIDSLYIVFLLGLILLNLKKSFRRDYFMYIYIILFILVVGIYEFHIPGATRHRLPIVLFIMLLAANSIEQNVLAKIKFRR